MNETITPRDLARDLGVSQRRIRDYLREQYGRLAEQRLSRWELTEEQAARVRAHFRA